MKQMHYLTGEVEAQDQKLRKVKIYYKVGYINEGDIKKITEDNIKNMTHLVGIDKIEKFDQIVKFRLQLEAGRKGLGVRVMEFEFTKIEPIEEQQQQKTA